MRARNMMVTMDVKKDNVVTKLACDPETLEYKVTEDGVSVFRDNKDIGKVVDLCGITLLEFTYVVRSHLVKEKDLTK